MSDPKFKDIGSITTRIMEEAAEVIQAVAKANRFGWYNHHPDRPESTNYAEVCKEMRDLNDTFNELQSTL